MTKKPDVVLLVTGEPDGYNRQHFWAFWPDWVGIARDTWGVRGQFFHAVLEYHVKSGRIGGYPERKQVVYLKDLPGMTEAQVIRHCEDLVRTKNPKSR